MFDRIEHVIAAYEKGHLSRRALLAQLGAMVTVTGLGRSARAAEAESSTFTAVGLNHIALDVADVARSREFYKEHLGLPVLRDGGQRSCFLGCGKEFVALFQSDKPGMNHYCYSIRDYDPDDAVTRLKTVNLAPRRSGNRVYFDDPDGLEVQVAEAEHGP